MTYDFSGHSIARPFILNTAKACGSAVLDALGYLLQRSHELNAWLYRTSHKTL